MHARPGWQSFLKQKVGQLKGIYIQRRLNEFYIWRWKCAPASGSGSQVVTQREAPGVEARKLSLYDQAAKLARQPVSLPAIQVAGLSPAEQQAIVKEELVELVRVQLVLEFLQYNLDYKLLT